MAKDCVLRGMIVEYIKELEATPDGPFYIAKRGEFERKAANKLLDILARELPSEPVRVLGLSSMSPEWIKAQIEEVKSAMQETTDPVSRVNLQKRLDSLQGAIE